MAGLGVAFVSIYAVRGEIATGRLRALRLRGVRIQRHFHVIHHEARRVPRARVYGTTRADRAAQKTIDVDPMRATDDAVMFVTSAGAIIRDARAGLRPVAAG